MEREATSSKPMLIATDIRKASVHGTFRNPSTKRSEVVKPTSNSPPMISHSQGMNFLSLDERGSFVTLAPHGQTADHRQHACPMAIPFVSRLADRGHSGRQPNLSSLGARRDGVIRR